MRHLEPERSNQHRRLLVVEFRFELVSVYELSAIHLLMYNVDSLLKRGNPMVMFKPSKWIANGKISGICEKKDVCHRGKGEEWHWGVLGRHCPFCLQEEGTRWGPHLRPGYG